MYEWLLFSTSRTKDIFQNPADRSDQPVADVPVSSILPTTRPMYSPVILNGSQFGLPFNLKPYTIPACSLSLLRVPHEDTPNLMALTRLSRNRYPSKKPDIPLVFEIVFMGLGISCRYLVSMLTYIFHKWSVRFNLIKIECLAGLIYGHRFPLEAEP